MKKLFYICRTTGFNVGRRDAKPHKDAMLLWYTHYDSITIGFYEEVFEGDTLSRLLRSWKYNRRNFRTVVVGGDTLKCRDIRKKGWFIELDYDELLSLAKERHIIVSCYDDPYDLYNAHSVETDNGDREVDGHIEIYDDYRE